MVLEHLDYRAFWRRWFCVNWRISKNVDRGFACGWPRMKLDGRNVLYRVSPQARCCSEPEELVADDIGDWPSVQGTVGDVDDDKDGYDESN